MKEQEVIATITKVAEGIHGMYAVALSDSIEGSITFSLEESDSVWQDNGFLEKGTQVVLSKLRKKKAGWRAYNARFLTPDDERNRNQKSETKGD